MAERQWYTAISGKQEGPFSDHRLRELIVAGTVRADTLVWCDGMSNWARAVEIPGLMSSAQSAAPLSPSLGSAAGPIYAASRAAAAVADDDHLAFDPQRMFDRVWPLFWRLIVLSLSVIAIIPLPWAAPWFISWFVDRIELPNGQRVRFEGKAGDIWYIFVLYALCSYASAGITLALNGLASLLVIPLTTLFVLIITRWFYAKLVWSGQSAPLKFTGSYWALLGWTVLAPLSFITIIGWAWVYTAWARWMCQNVTGMQRQFVFTGGGWSYLWRTVTFVLMSYLLFAMPWMLRWYVRWLVSRFALVNGTAPVATSA